MQISEAVRAFLDEPRFAVLATIGASGVPQQTVMWYVLDGDDVVMNTAGGRLKEANVRRRPRVSICVPDGYRFVTLVGTAELIYDQSIAQADIARLARRYHNAAAAERAIAGFRTQERVTIRVHVDRVLARGF